MVFVSSKTDQDHHDDGGTIKCDMLRLVIMYQQSDTMITNDYDWKVILLIEKIFDRQNFSSELIVTQYSNSLRYLADIKKIFSFSYHSGIEKEKRKEC